MALLLNDKKRRKAWSKNDKNFSNKAELPPKSKKKSTGNYGAQLMKSSMFHRSTKWEAREEHFEWLWNRMALFHFPFSRFFIEWRRRTELVTMKICFSSVRREKKAAKSRKKSQRMLFTHVVRSFANEAIAKKVTNARENFNKSPLPFLSFQHFHLPGDCEAWN